nr:unnamed protein product [Callosobruchus analis]
MEFLRISTSAFYGKSRVDAIRDIPSYSEDSELSDDEDGAELAAIQNGDEIQEFQEDVSEGDDIPYVPLRQLLTLPPNTKLYCPENENITWRESRTVRNPQQNIFLGTHDLPEGILELNGPYELFKFFSADDFIRQTVEQTCLYSVQKRSDKPFTTNPKEIEQFLRILIWMSLIFNAKVLGTKCPDFTNCRCDAHYQV